MNAWKNMNTADLYGALLKPNPEQAMQDLLKARRALNLSANRARIKAGKRLMNEFHKRIMNLIAEFDSADELRSYPYLMQEFDDTEFTALVRDYMEYCYD